MSIKEKSLPILFTTKYTCCGCGACSAICPKSAIYMEEDEEGFMYPHLDKDKCVMCHMCVKVCPLK